MNDERTGQETPLAPPAPDPTPESGEKRLVYTSAIAAAMEMRAKESTPSRERLTNWFNENPDLAIVGTISLGLLFAVLLLIAYKLGCMTLDGEPVWWGHDVYNGVCKMIAGNPPWLLVSAVAASPVAALTWYWRTVHKQEDLANTRRTLEQQYREASDRRQEAMNAERNTARQLQLARQAQVNDRIAKAVSLLGEDKLVLRIMALSVIRAIAEDSPEEHNVLRGVLASFICGRWPYRPDPNDYGDDDDPSDYELVPVDDRQIAVEMLGNRRLWRSKVTALRLPDALLCGLTLSDLSFVNAYFAGSNFGGSLLTRVDFNNCNFDRVRLRRIQAENVKFAGSTFHWVDLRDAKFEGSCDFDGCKFVNVSVASADLRGAVLHRATFDTVRYNGQTQFPKDLDPVQCGFEKHRNEG